jgi:hypothetical protein
MTDESPLDPRLLQSYSVDEPPPDLADRVLERLQAERQPPRRGRAVLGAVAISVAAALAIGLGWPRGRVASGEARVTTRATLALEHRGTAVAEPGATLRWQIAADGAAEVVQSTGDVFYRVERGGPFVVHTPGGDVTVKGTCFRVEVGDMKRSVWVAGTVGAAAATTVLVSVYEGRVLLANERGRAEVAAGAQAVAAGDRAPRPLDEATPQKLVSALDAPTADVTREELLRRDQVQRDAITRLSGEVKKLRAASEEEEAPGGRKRAGEGREPTYVDPPKDELVEAAKKCRLNWDTPSLDSNKLGTNSKKLGLSPEEETLANKATEEFNARTLKELRALYTEVTGDARGAEALSATALEQEIIHKSASDDQLRQLFQQISGERAGLRPPSFDPKTAPVAERFFRLVTGMGDQYERALAGAIGASRAHELRTKDNGWGNRHGSSYGCPGGDE